MRSIGDYNKEEDYIYFTNEESLSKDLNLYYMDINILKTEKRVAM